MEWQRYKNIADKYFPGKKFNEGDVVLYKTVTGQWKKTVLKKTLQGSLFIEAAEVKNKEFAIVKITELPEEDVIYMPKYEELLEKLELKTYKYDSLLKSLEDR